MTNERAVSYQYDAASNRVRMDWPDGYHVTYAYDGLNRMTGVLETGSVSLAAFAYDPLSRTASITYGNGASTSFAYEPDSDLKSLTHGFVTGGEALAGGGTGAAYTYQYTKAGQLREQSANHAGFQFEPPELESVVYAANSLNQYTSVEGTALSYDNNGNLANDGANAFTFDAENRLTSAAMGSGASVAYEYDPMGRRARKSVDGVFTDFVHDSDHLIAEYDGSGALLRRYVHGPGTDRPVALVEGGAGSGYTHTYYHADRLGSVIALTDDAGAETARYTYSAYGVPYLVDPGTGAQTQVAAGQPHLFTGRRFDFETGLYYYRARYYSATLGRFLQTDPIGMQDQMNLYAYVANDPVNLIDPTGKYSEMKINHTDKTIEITIPVKYQGDKITSKQKRAIEDEIEDVFKGKLKDTDTEYDGYTVKTTVVEDNSRSDSRSNQITIKDHGKDNPPIRSHAKAGGRTATLHLKGKNPTGSSAHEFGHILGIEQEGYIEGTPPDGS